MMEAQALGFVLHQSPYGQSYFSHRTESLIEPSDREALSLLETWWDFKCQGGMIVGKHFPTRRWSELLPHIALVEKVKGETDFRVRLAGFSLLCFYGFDLRGKRLSEIHDRQRFLSRYREMDNVLATDRPHVARAGLYYGDEPFLSREVVSLPVLASDTRTRLVLVASFWTHRRWLN